MINITNDWEWVAVKTDSTILQFDDKGEHLFQEVIDAENTHSLDSFTLRNNTQQCFVSLKLGVICFVANFEAKIEFRVFEGRDNLKLYFVRRHIQEFGKEERIQYRIGLLSGEEKAIFVIEDNKLVEIER